MQAVKREFVRDDERHKWFRKGEEPTEEEEEEGIIDTLKDLV